MGFSMRAGVQPGRAPAPRLADWNPFPGPLLPSLGAPCVPSSSGPSPAGHGCFGGCPGTAPWGAGEAVSTLGRLSYSPGSLGGASAPGGLRRGASGRGCGCAQSWGGRSLRAQGQASLARPQLGRGARGVNPGLGGSSWHWDGGDIMGPTGRVHIGHPVHGQRGCPVRVRSGPGVRAAAAALCRASPGSAGRRPLLAEKVPRGSGLALTLGPPAPAHNAEGGASRTKCGPRAGAGAEPGDPPPLDRPAGRPRGAS